MKISIGYYSIYPKSWVSCSKASFVVYQTLENISQDNQLCQTVSDLQGVGTPCEIASEMASSFLLAMRVSLNIVSHQRHLNH
jgi:hypothetical protein